METWAFFYIDIFVIFNRYVYSSSGFDLRYDFKPFKNEMIVSASIRKTNKTPVMTNKEIIKPSKPPFVEINVFNSVNNVTPVPIIVTFIV